MFAEIFPWPKIKAKMGVIMTKLNEYFVPKQISIYERFVFNCCSQKSGENFDQIFTWRRKLAATCQFGTFKDETMRDRIVTGLRDHGHRELQIAINICRTNEMAASQRHKIREQNGAIWHSSPCPREQNTWTPRGSTQESLQDQKTHMQVETV